MSKFDKLQRGIKRLIEIDSDIGKVTRDVKAPGERPGQQPVPTGDKTTHEIICRVTYQSASIWPGRLWEGGLTVDTSPYVLAFVDDDLEQGDILEWRDKRYLVGVVTRPDGTCTQAPLTEVK